MAYRKEQQKSNRINNQAAQEKAIPRKQWRGSGQSEQKKPFITLPTYNELKMLIVFLLACMAGLLALDRFPVPSDALHNMLGMAPPLMWIHVAFACYFASEFILLFCRQRKNDTNRFAVKQQLFMGAFFVFYWYAGVLPQLFPLLVIYGILLQSGEAFARKNPLRHAIIEDL